MTLCEPCQKQHVDIHVFHTANFLCLLQKKQEMINALLIGFVPRIEIIKNNWVKFEVRKDEQNIL